jgi:hypothetical protein
MSPEYWLGVFNGATGIGVLWWGCERWRSKAREKAWRASQKRRADAEIAYAFSTPSGAVKLVRDGDRTLTSEAGRLRNDPLHTDGVSETSDAAQRQGNGGVDG